MSIYSPASRFAYCVFAYVLRSVLWQSSIHLLNVRSRSQSIWFVLGLVNLEFLLNLFSKIPKHAQTKRHFLGILKHIKLELPILVELSFPEEPKVPVIVILPILRMFTFAFVSGILNFVHTIRSGTDQLLQKLSMTFTANSKRQKWNFCCHSSAVCTVEWNYLYLWWTARDVILFLCALFMNEKKRAQNQSYLCL